MAWVEEDVVASSGSAEAEATTAGTAETKTALGGAAETKVATMGTAETRTAVGGAVEVKVATGGSAESETVTAGAREAPTMDYVLRLNHGDVRPYRDSFLFEWKKTMRLGQKHGNGKKWRLGEQVCDWTEDATTARAGSAEAVTAGSWQEEAVTP